MDVEDNTPKSEPAHIQQEDSARDDNDASSIKSLSDLSLSNMNISLKEKIDLESRKNSKENRDLVNYFHNANNNFIEALREYAKDKLENPKMIQKDVINSFRILQAELKNKEIKGDSPKKKENADKNDNKNVDTTEAVLNSLVEECEKFHDDNDKDDTDHDHDLECLESVSDISAEEEETITYIDDFLTLISERALVNDWPDTIKYRLDIILRLSKRKYIALYMMEYDILQKILVKVQSRPELVEIIFSIILNINELFDEAIDWIGNHKEFVVLILDQLKSTNDSVLINLMKVLKLAIYSIQTNRYSRWLVNLKEYEPFAYQIIALFRLQFNETLITEATDLLKDMAKIRLSTQPIFQQLFNDKIPDLISTLMMSCTQMLINKKKSVSPINSEYIYNWLTIMMVVKSHLAIVFDKTEEKEKYILLKILIVLLHPYQKASSLFPERNLKQDLRAIFKSMCLLSYIHRHFYIPMIMDRNLMRIILNLQAVITDDISFEEEEEGVEIQELMRKLLSYLRDLWGNIIQCRNSAFIGELWKAFTNAERQYFVELANNHPKIKHNTRIINDLMKKKND